MNLFQLLALSALAVDAAPATSQKSYATSSAATWDGCQYQVKGVGNFNTHLSVDFTKISKLPSTLQVSTNTIGAGPYAPYARRFDASNIKLGTDGLTMLVPGGQKKSPISSAQLITTWDDILHGSVRTVAIASNVPGTVHGLFFYMDDSQETDIEIRTSELSQVYFTNQITKPGNPETSVNMTAPKDMTTAWHEYRIDWVPGKTMFYIDGVLKHTMTQNIPSEAGQWMWNNWA